MTDVVALNDRILPWNEVHTLTSLSRFTIRQLEIDDRFPQRISLGSARRVGWLESEVRAWVEERLAERSNIAAARDAKARRTPSVWNRVSDEVDRLLCDA